MENQKWTVSKVFSLSNINFRLLCTSRIVLVRYRERGIPAFLEQPLRKRGLEPAASFAEFKELRLPIKNPP